MHRFFTQRHQLLGLALGLYLIPLWVVSVFSMSYVSHSQSWRVLSLGLLLSLAGAFVLFFVLRGWEEALKMVYTQEISENSCMDEVGEPCLKSEELFKLEEQIQALEFQNKRLVQELSDQVAKTQEDLSQLSLITEEYASFRTHAEEKIEQNEIYIHELHQEISDQKNALQTKDKWILDLESQVQDRSYEVKTLLKLTDLPQFKKEALMEKEEKIVHTNGSFFRPSPSLYSLNEEVLDEAKVHNPEGASHHLKQCIDIAQKITGANHFASGSSLFRDLPVNSYALDLRRLCDSLGNENMAAVGVYSKKENRLLFANHEIRNLLGWSSEKFAQDFSEIVQEGFPEWKNKVFSLIEYEEGKVRLLVKTKAGENLLLNCHLGLIPAGIFRNHVVAVFYPA
ncbi:MAG: hypothetical protein CK425_06345 [Parachlamydia sp.]|nr:MAG: hypothetical protein CK425_06345 [Parachlamydia sp.]